MNRRQALPVLLAAAAFATASAGTAVAGHAAFSDAAGTHEAGIHWLAESGVTGGCGGGKFCTEDAVKRGQMATFLHRLSGKGSVPPVVNADKVDGLDAEQLRGQQGVAGPAGPAGEVGAAGPAGPQGPAASAQIVYVDKTVEVDRSQDGWQEVLIPCPEGTKPISADLLPEGFNAVGSPPVIYPDVTRSGMAMQYLVNPYGPSAFTLRAVCGG